jgi:tRNA nucleotidyltransferase (CCA-adding enzyme)
MMILPPQVNTAISMLYAAGYEAFLVGGAVRDYVRDNSPAKDWDITTNALPAQVESVFSGYHLIETGLKHGTVTVVIDHEPIEITTYRIDGDYSDHRHPDSVHFTRSLKEDLERRDFTMNALAYSPQKGIVDLVGGRKDIEDGIVRCVGDPNHRFQEDGLRMLRALRFASVYGMAIEAETASAIHRNKELLKGIAAERIQVELTKMLCGKGVTKVLEEFSDVIAIPIPEILPMFHFEQRNPHHDKDVWDHTIAVIESITPEPVLRWAALLHDIGKPSCFSLAEEGIGHFFGHSDQSTSMAESILSRLRFDNASKEQIVRLVRYHDMPITADRKPIKRLLSKHGEDATRQLIELHKADTLGQSAICRHRIAIFEEVSQMINEILQEESCFTLKDLAANGHDMMTLGFQGPTIGRVLQECLDAVLDEQIPNEHEALMAFAKDRQLKS